MSENSMFDEFIKVKERFEELNNKYGDKANDHIMPAMIILEKMENGENKHAIVGQPYEIYTLIDWALSTISDGYGIPFEDLLEVISEMHKHIDHVYLNNITKEI